MNKPVSGRDEPPTKDELELAATPPGTACADVETLPAVGEPDPLSPNPCRPGTTNEETNAAFPTSLPPTPTPDAVASSDETAGPAQQACASGLDSKTHFELPPYSPHGPQAISSGPAAPFLPSPGLQQPRPESVPPGNVVSADTLSLAAAAASSAAAVLPVDPTVGEPGEPSEGEPDEDSAQVLRPPDGTPLLSWPPHVIEIDEHGWDPSSVFEAAPRSSSGAITQTLATMASKMSGWTAPSGDTNALVAEPREPGQESTEPAHRDTVADAARASAPPGAANANAADISTAAHLDVDDMKKHHHTIQGVWYQMQKATKTGGCERYRVGNQHNIFKASEAADWALAKMGDHFNKEPSPRAAAVLFFQNMMKKGAAAELHVPNEPRQSLQDGDVFYQFWEEPFGANTGHLDTRYCPSVWALLSRLADVSKDHKTMFVSTCKDAFSGNDASLWIGVDRSCLLQGYIHDPKNPGATGPQVFRDSPDQLYRVSYVVPSIHIKGLAYHVLGHVYITDSDYGNVEHRLPSPVRTAMQGYRCVAAGDVVSAEVALGAALDEDPWCAVALHNMAALKQEFQDDTQAAQVLLRRLVDAHPHSPGAWHTLAVFLHSNTSQEESAQAAFRKAFDLCEDNALLVTNYAIFMHDIGRLEVADTLYQRAIKLANKKKDSGSKNQTHLCNYAMLLQQSGMWDRAQQQWLKAYTADSSNPVTLLGYAMNLHVEGRDNGAANMMYEKAYEKLPDHLAVSYNYAHFLETEMAPKDPQKFFPKAIEAYSRAVDAAPTDGVVLNSKAACLLSAAAALGQSPPSPETLMQAETAFLQGLKHNPDDHALLCNYSVFLRDYADKPDKAAEWFAKGIKTGVSGTLDRLQMVLVTQPFELLPVAGRMPRILQGTSRNAAPVLGPRSTAYPLKITVGNWMQSVPQPAPQDFYESSRTRDSRHSQQPPALQHDQLAAFQAPVTAAAVPVLPLYDSEVNQLRAMGLCENEAKVRSLLQVLPSFCGALWVNRDCPALSGFLPCGSAAVVWASLVICPATPRIWQKKGGNVEAVVAALFT
eukprot:gene8254-1474_t